MPEQLTWKVEYELRKSALIASGQMDGLNFALQVSGDRENIEKEIADREETRQRFLESSSFGENNPMTPGASPRIYLDAYISGLQAAIALIEKLRDDDLTTTPPAR